MIPTLIVPVLRTDLVWTMLATVDVPVGLTIIIDNGGELGPVPGAHVITMPTNIGVAASWNLGVKATIRSPWWAIVNDDVAFASGDLERLAQAMAEPGPQVRTLDGFSAFGINAEALDAVGLWDEGFVAAYCEDADWEYRAKLVGVEIVPLPAGLRHERSSTIALPKYREQNDRTYPANRALYRDKWGGDLRGGERYDSPYDSGAGPQEWTLDTKRLRELAWTP